MLHQKPKPRVVVAIIILFSSSNSEGKMYKPFVFPRNHKLHTTGRKIIDREPVVHGSVSGGRRSQCVICAANASMVAESLDRKNQNWYCFLSFSPLVVPTCMPIVHL